MQRARALASALIWTLAASSAAALTYVPARQWEPRTKPQVWFGQRAKDGRWCAFGWDKVKSISNTSVLAPPETGWARYHHGKLATITITTTSEDAYVEDRYFFGTDRTISKMIRTGHYIQSPWASFTYIPGKGSKLVMTADAKAIEAKMGKAEYETYIVDWPTYSTLAAMPFAELVDWTQASPIRLGCAKHPKPIAHDD